MKYVNHLLVAGSVLLLAGCGKGDQSDLSEFIDETYRRPPGKIEDTPIPKPYEAFTYSAQKLREPFRPPVREVAGPSITGNSSVKPDFSRPKEVLESFAIGSLNMVGTYQWQGSLWALVDDGAGDIHRVRDGNYLGKNHGKIIATSPTQLDIVEIVTDGTGDGWVERPISLKLTERGN